MLVISYIISIYWIVLSVLAAPEKITFISTEHPNCTFFNPRYLTHLNITSRRYSRYDPRYYVDLHYHSICNLHNNVSLHFYFFEFLSNRYRRGFVEMDFKYCDLIHKDLFFGRAMRQGKLAQPCPYPPGEYHLYNMTIPVSQVPPNFPFTKGRIYCNVTSRDNHDLIASLYIDMEIKTLSLRKKTNNNKTPPPKQFND